MNTYQWCLVERYAKIKLPNLKYHNKRGRLGLRDNIYLMQELFETLEVEGAPTTED